MPSNLKIPKPVNKGYEVDQPGAGQGEKTSATTELGPSTQSPNNPPRKKFFMGNTDINTTLNNGPELLGDLSRPCALPCILKGTRHGDLKTISNATLALLIQGKFAKELGPGGGYQIIDCRYPYEFTNGHIRGAKNLYTPDQILQAFPSLGEEEPEEGEVEAPEPPRRIYVFHCEFSSVRAPKLMRYLRNHDRLQNIDRYPQLDYPELYLLHQGYSEFFDKHLDLCEPQRYVRMLSPTYKEDYRQCRNQATLAQQRKKRSP